MARPLRPHAQVIAALALPLLLAGCSGTPFGERLSRAFPPPGSGDPAARPAEPSSTQAPTQAPTPVPPVVPGAATSASAGTGGKPPTGQGGSASLPPGASRPITTKPGAGGVSQAVPRTPGRPGPAAVPSPAAKPAASAAPYRVTIRLPQADPAAPAEVVTQALRLAGVPFEVETIERIAPAAPTAPAPAPAVRPAPAPRP